MRKKLYKAKKKWVIGLIASALFVIGGGATAQAADNTDALPASAQVGQFFSYSQPTVGWNGIDTSSYAGVSSDDPANIDTSILDANVRLNVTGKDAGGDTTTPGFSYNVSTNGHQMTNSEDVSVDYYFGSSAADTRYGTNGADFDQGYSDTIAYAPTFRNSVYNSWVGVNGTISNSRIEISHSNDSNMTHSINPNNRSDLVKEVTVNGNVITNTISVRADYGAVQPGVWGITINPYWRVNGVLNVYNTAAPYRNGNAFYYIIRDANGRPQWLEIIRPLNGTKLFTGHNLNYTTGPLGGQQVGGNSSTAPHSARSLYMMAPEGTTATFSYTEAYYWIGDGINNPGVNVNAGYLDGYQLQEQGGQPVLRVHGWHASSNSSEQSTGYLILFDNTTGKELTRHRINNPVTRNDIANLYQNVANSRRSGFDEQFVIPSWALGHQFTIVARYTDDVSGGEGHHTDLWLNQRISFDMNNNAYLDNVKLVNKNVTVSGWHATNAALGRDYHYIIVWDASARREITRSLVRKVNRPDVARAFPKVMNANDAGFSTSFLINNPAYANDQIQFISRWTSDPNGNNNFVDYWFAPQRILSDNGNYGYLDSYRLTNRGLQVSGWHATNTALGREYHTIIVLNARNRHEIGRQTIWSGQRVDVARAFPKVLNADESGFNTLINFNSAMVTDPVQIISRWSATADANSNYVDYWFKPVQLLADQGNYAYLDGMNLVGNSVRITGWHASNQAFSKPYHWIILFDQTLRREVGRCRVIGNTTRTDVAKAFPNVNNAGNSGYNVLIVPKVNIRGDRLQVVSRWTDDPFGNGNGTDYWFAPRVLL